MSHPIRILHLADSHIGAGLPPRPRRSRRRRGDDLIDSYRRVVARALECDVDLVIHAGDVFDKPAPGDGLVTAAAEPLLRIACAGIPVVVVPGNHERSCIPASLLLAHERIHIAGEPATFRFRLRGCRVSIAAMPCIRRCSAERFAAAVAKTGWAEARGDIHLLAVHQTFESAVCGPVSFRFRSGDDVIERDDVPSEFAYVAAGHIHRHQVLDSPHDNGPPIVYSGSCDRVSFAEVDEPKGCVLIEIGSDGGLTHRFIEHAVRPMVAVPLDLSGLARRQIFERIMERVAALPPNAVAVLRLSGKTTRRDVRGLDIHRKALDARPDVSLTSVWRAVEFVPQRTVARLTGGDRASAFASLNVPAGEMIQCRRDDCKPLPAARGVYALYDADDRLLYVGKAAHVRSRVRTHIRGRSDAGAFTGWTARIARVEARPAHSELEALLIEADLIRRLRPPFNSRMRSWERYRYLCRSDRPYAQLEVCRDRPADSLCFGPYSSRFAAEDILEAVAAEFGTARCPATCAARGRPTLFPAPGPADLCERYFDARCNGPCGKRISDRDYMEAVNRRDALLGGLDDS
ncbi:MAG: metallophosphoesterase family protein, partial [Planctomycetes bacterium]|nr:metallophosphoesterase family protein [Planctomycetota bacterium]